MDAIFAMNPRLRDQKTGKIESKYNRGYAEPVTVAQVMDKMFGPGSMDMKAIVRSIRQGHEELKEELPFLCPHYSEFRDNHRAQSDIIPEAFTHRTCVDVDDKELVEEARKRAMNVNQDPLSDWEGMVEYIEYSARKKLHIWIRIPKGMTIEEAQRAFCKEIDIPFDESCITPERFIYMTGDAVFRSMKWLQPLTEEEIKERREAYLERGLDVDGRPLKAPEAKSAPKPVEPSNVYPADKRTRLIIKEIMKKEGVTTTDLTEEGGRHNAVKMLLSHATQLLKEAEFLGVLRELMPQNWQDQNIRQLVKDFYAKYYDESAKLTEFQKEVFRKSRNLETKQDEKTYALTAQVYGDTAPLAEIYASQQPPLLPAKLPNLVKTVTSLTPAELKATVAQGMFPPLGAYPCKLSFLYIDNQYRELRMNCLTIGDTGSGKDTSLKQPLKHITAPMAERDNINRQRLKEFNEQYNATKANKDKPKRPADLIIQKVGSDLTPARLSQLMDDSQGAMLYTQMNEFEQWYGVEGMRGQVCTFKNLKLADDEDNPFGQERAGVQSVNYTGPLGLNWNASTTPSKAQSMFRYVLVDGPVSRVCLGTTPNVGLAAPMPRFGRYDERYDKALKPYIENLQAATGEIECRPAYRLAERLKAECDQYTLVTQDEVFDNLSHRALVHAFRKACLLYAANGMKWEKAIEGFCRWSLHYDLWLKLHFFGDMIRKEGEQTKTSKRGPRNLLEQIATDAEGAFTMSDAISVRLLNNKNEEGTANMLSQWKTRGYIESLPDGRFRKLLMNDK